MSDAKATHSKKRKRYVPQEGRVTILTTFNNTIVTATTQQGDVIIWASAGSCGFKGARQGTPFAGCCAAGEVAEKISRMGMTVIEVYIKGPGSARDSSVKEFTKRGIKVTRIEDRTPLPHNGVRRKKKRRV